MSKENVKKFYDAPAQDAALVEELDARIAAEKGLEFTAEEIAATTLELSPEDLDNVNGGVELGREIMRELNRIKYGKK